MTAPPQRAVILSRLLQDIARGGFRGIDDEACAEVLAAARAVDEVRDWRDQVAEYHSLAKPQRAVLMAKGLRLCRSQFGVVRAATVAARERLTVLDDGVQTLPGIGPALSDRLAEVGIHTVEDLVWLVPRRYDDARSVVSISDLSTHVEAGGGRVTCRGPITRARFFRKGRRRWVDVRLGIPGAPELVVRWFSAHQSMVVRLCAGRIVTLSGPVRERGGVLEMSNPDVVALVEQDGTPLEEMPAIISRYADIPGVPAKTLRKVCKIAIERAQNALVDGVPETLAQRRGLVPLSEALLCLHDPPEDISNAVAVALCEGSSQWHRRLAYDELFLFGVAVAMRRARHRELAAPVAPVCTGLQDAISDALGFELTGAQQRAARDICADISVSVPMNRLLQGDVGSGKTAVALAAMVQVCRSDLQCAFMAPTEILAEQHYRSLSKVAIQLGLCVELLTASTSRPVRASLLARLGAGRIDVLVGTHSLLAEGVVFQALGLAVVDEQHRFGVAQRVRLRSKGTVETPHLLVMTATPIPRTLALTAYGDLDVSVVDEMPPGRQPVATRVLRAKSGRDKAYDHVAKRVERGDRAYVVCPLVEPREEDDDPRAKWASAVGVYEEVSARLGAQRVGLVHGRMNSAERDEVMASFRDGGVQVLVATTVIEVGVDVPEATAIVIEDADRFGLAQLHQLRGRVGRGGGLSVCLLLTKGRATEDGAERLRILKETNDGFRIAEADLMMRGPGEVLGKKQAGLPKLRFGNLAEHAELLRLAREDADAVVAADPTLDAPEHAALRAVFEQRTSSEVIYAESG